MATTFSRSFTIDAPPDAVSRAMRDPGLIEESERSREALEVEIRDVEKTDQRHGYDIRTVNYARSVTGIDRSKTEASTTEVRWDLTRGTRRWVWRGNQPKVKIEGNDALREAPGGRTVLDLSTSIEVGIPMVGKVVEKKIRDGFEENWPKYVAMVERHARNG